VPCPRYAGPAQAPFGVDVGKQRLGEASPFRMERVPVAAHDGFAFHDVGPLHLASLASFADLRRKMAALDPAPDAAAVDAYTVRSFRPNVVVGPAPGSLPLEPWAEVIGSAIFLKKAELESFALLLF